MSRMKAGPQFGRNRNTPPPSCYISPNAKRLSLEQFTEVVNDPARRGGLFHFCILHDPGCPATDSRNMQDCVCSPDFEVWREVGQ